MDKILLVDNGSVYEMSLMKVKDGDTALSAAAKKTINLVALGNGNAVICGASSPLFLKKIDGLDLSMRWTATTDGETIVPNPSNGTMMLKKWRVPSFINAYFAKYCGTYSLLFLIDGKLMQIPLPNVYRTSRLCTGDLDFEENPCLLTSFNLAYDAWRKNDWNSDLMGEHEGKEEDLAFFFSFTESGQVERTKEEWTARMGLSEAEFPMELLGVLQ